MDLSTNSSGVVELAVGKGLRGNGALCCPLRCKSDVLSRRRSESDVLFPVATLLSLFLERGKSRYNLLVIDEGDPSLDGVSVSTLAGDNIPLDARNIAIADAYESMTSPRPYRERTLTHKEALKGLAHNVGTQFDPELVKVFCAFKKRTSPTRVKPT